MSENTKKADYTVLWALLPVVVLHMPLYNSASRRQNMVG
jgi:hypothetical protein